MASVAYHHYCQLQSEGVLKLFEGCDGYADGEQVRDFVYVGDTVKVKLWLLDNPGVSGIFNCGTGRAEPFNEIANGVIGHFGQGELKYIPFPDHLVGSYQSFTQADMSKLREAGFKDDFRSVAEGVRNYMDWLIRSDD
jgi:ADP-L-glycero-D-manno-heptose 6-epimerase